MTIRELYQTIEGDYDQAIRTLRMDKLLDKHIRKLAHNGVIERLFAVLSAFKDCLIISMV